jgi:hypothetical protein
MDDFLADFSAQAFEKVVDRLLGSPHYGEQWGRHWLDVVRYADTSGCNSDFPVPSAYKYRNYVIRSFNQDKPFDVFLREQIAGDLLPARTDEEHFEKIIATGYLAIARRFGSRAAEFHLTIEDTIDNLGKAVLGLSLGCARCHDHKYDPVSMTDYYALYGILNSTRYAFPGTEIYRHPKDFIPLVTGTNYEAVLKHQEELATLDDKIENLLEQKRAIERLEKAESKEARKEPPDPKEEAKEKSPNALKLLEVKAALEDARTRQKQLEGRAPAVEKAFAVMEGQAANAKVHVKGDPKNLGAEVARGFLEVLGGQKVPAGCTNSGRLELARWLTDPQNPLTARVLVNRIWQHHFGRGLVPTPNDFGTRGQPPTHPELLDYLTSHFLETGWSIKSLHKLVLLSRAYQMASSHEPRHAALDPNNDYFWRFNRRRLSAEEIRDAMLALSGALDRTMGGEHPFPPEDDWRYTQHKPFIAVYDTNRRSVYLMQQRIKKHPYLEIFDGADPNVTTAQRPASTSPLQALFLMNNAFAHEQADRLAVRIGMAFSDEAKRIHYAYQLVFGRPATKEDIRTGRQYLEQCRAALRESQLAPDQQPRAALASYVRVLLSSSEFLHVD